MLTLMRNGGFPMWFILLFGLMSLGAAAYFAMRTEQRVYGFIKWMSVATLCTVVSGTAADLGETCFTVASVLQGKPGPAGYEHVAWYAMLLEGVAESMSPVIMGVSLVGLTALLTAIGRRRMDARKA
jgi:hypothetical protein